MKLILYPTAALSTLFLIAGCSTPPPVDEPELAFCDAAEPFVYTQAELIARTDFPENLRKEFKINKTGERVCGWFDAE